MECEDLKLDLAPFKLRSEDKVMSTGVCAAVEAETTMINVWRSALADPDAQAWGNRGQLQ